MKLVSIKRMKVCSAIFVACLILFSNLANCAQLVNELPTKLEHNWQICKHFSSSPPQCTSADTLATSLPKDKNTTHYEYTKQFIVSSDFQEELLGLFLGRIDEVDQVRINGRLIGKSGRFPPNYQTGFRHQRLYFIPPSIIKYNQFNLIEVRTFSTIGRPGLGKAPVEIGQFFKLKKDRKTSNHIFVIAISVLIVLALFQLFYFLMVRESEETLFLSIFLIAFAIVAYARSEYPMHIGFNLTTTLKIEMFMISSGLIGLVLFAFRFFELRIGRDHLVFILLIGLPGIVSIIYPEPTHTRIIAEVGYWLICIASLVIGLYIFLSTQLKNKKYIRVIIVFSLIFWFTMGYDALSQTRWLVNFEINLRPWLLPIIVTSMGVAMALTMTHRYWQLFKGATYDHLTGTLLRPAFFQRLSAELQRSQIDQSLLLVAVINIKGIRNITANYGLQARDRTLKVISTILTNQLKPFDLICHFSDNEFCVAATIDSREQGTEYIEEIHQRLTSSQFIIDKETELFVGVKIGGVIYNPDQHLSISQILLDANYALAKAKDKKGKDYWLQNNPTVTA